MTKTLRHILIAIMAVATFSLVACEKDHDRPIGGNGTDGDANGGSGSGKQLTCITMVEDGISEVKAELHWAGQLLNRVNLFENERGQWREVGYAQPTYEGSRMTSVFAYSNEEAAGATVSATYVVDKLVSIMARNEEVATIGYDATGRPSIITADGETMSLQWQGDNITALTSPDGERVTLSYDQNYFPLNDILALLIPGWTNGMNCPVSIVNPEGERMDITYRYSGNYPTVATMGRDGESVQIYFNYADGTGEAAPAPVATYYVYWWATPWEAGYVEDQDGNRNTERRFNAGATLTLAAVPYDGYHFSHWSDGSDDNPRTITVTGDAEFCAVFEEDGSTPTPVTSSNSVTFGDYTWSNVVPFDFLYATQYNNALIGYLSPTAPDTDGSINFPVVLIYLQNINTTSYSLSLDESAGSFNGGGRIEYYESNILELQGGQQIGDWVSKNATVNVTSYNFGTHTVSMTINATMLYLYDYAYGAVQNISDCATRQLSITINNVSWEYYQATSTAFNRNLNTLRRR